MDDLTQELLAIERELAEGDGGAYRRRLREDAIVIVPGQRLDKEQTAAAIDQSGGWETIELTDASSLRLGEGAALVSYRFDGKRGELRYSALLSSAYVRDERDRWRLAFHQQTPLE